MLWGCRQKASFCLVGFNLLLNFRCQQSFESTQYASFLSRYNFHILMDNSHITRLVRILLEFERIVSNWWLGLRKIVTEGLFVHFFRLFLVLFPNVMGNRNWWRIGRLWCFGSERKILRSERHSRNVLQCRKELRYLKECEWKREGFGFFSLTAIFKATQSTLDPARGLKFCGSLGWSGTDLHNGPSDGIKLKYSFKFSKRFQLKKIPQTQIVWFERLAHAFLRWTDTRTPSSRIERSYVRKEITE